MSLLLDKNRIKDIEHLKDVITILKTEITAHNQVCTFQDIADALSCIKIRDAMLYLFCEEPDTLNAFINWWANNISGIKSHLNDEQKAHMLVVMSGALLLQNLPDGAEEAADNCIVYSQKANMPTPGLARLIKSAIMNTRRLNKPEDAHIVWKDSLKNVSMEEILNT